MADDLSNFERSFDHEDAVYGAKIAARRARILSVVAVEVEYFYFTSKRKDKRWRTS